MHPTELRKLAIQYATANSGSKTARQVVEEAQEYLAFLNGDNEPKAANSVGANLLPSEMGKSAAN